MKMITDAVSPPMSFGPEEKGEEVQEFIEPLSGYILKRYAEYEDDKRSTGVEQMIIDSLRAVNMEYSADDLAKIAEEGSSPIFVGLTSAKSRALAAFIKDILLGADKPYSISPSPIPDLPEEIKEQVEEYFKSQDKAEKAEDIKATNQRKRDLEISLADEINKIAKHSFGFLETEVEDNLSKGSFSNALSDVIDDFAWAPTAILKGPIVTRDDKLTWSNGNAVTAPEYIFFNKRVNPLDFYPSPDGASFIEKLRLNIEEIGNLIDVQGYNKEVLTKAIDDPSSTQTYDSAIDNDVAREEKTTSSTAPTDEIQGLHWHGAIPSSLLADWGIEVNGPVAQVECILIGSEVAKVCLNKDALCRKPYYSASFQRRPGAFWGISLPSVMSPEQRMCNATVRSLALNLGLSASPQCMISIDRLADDGEIDEIYGGKIWQVKSDPTGNSGRPLDFFNVPSNASELLAIFERFLALADETTGIPRYTYGQAQGTGGAAGTAQGLAMLLENTTKTIKDAVRHIDEGIIVPRVEREFYQIMLKPDSNYTGDIEVVARGSQALANRAAEQLKQNEFIRVTANPIDQGIMGEEGRAVLLREMAKSLNLPESIVPSRMELKQKEQGKAESAQKQMELEMKKISIPIEVAQIQTQGAAQNAQINAQVKAEGNQVDKLENDQDFQIAQAELQLDKEKTQGGWASDQQKEQMRAATKVAELQQKTEDTNKSIALSIKSGYEDKSNMQ